MCLFLISNLFSRTTLINVQHIKIAIYILSTRFTPHILNIHGWTLLYIKIAIYILVTRFTPHIMNIHGWTLLSYPMIYQAPQLASRLHRDVIRYDKLGKVKYIQKSRHKICRMQTYMRQRKNAGDWTLSAYTSPMLSWRLHSEVRITHPARTQ